MRLIIALLAILFTTNAAAIQTINVTRGNFDPIPIAINKFDSDSRSSELGEKIHEVVTNDLKSSGLFHPIPSAAFIENKLGVDHRPLFAAWRQINATILVNAKIRKLSSGTIEVSFILWDIVSEKDIAGEVFEVQEKLWRRVAHKIADKIYERITGDRGYFDTKVAYVSEVTTSTKITKRIAIMDQDGANHAFLTDGKNLTLTPRLSPKGDKLLYLSFVKGKKAKVHMRDLRSGKDVTIGNFPNMNFAPRFSPDGSKALISISKNGATNIFEIDMYSMQLKQLTHGVAISTSPSYSPDGQKIVFNSDRGGSPQLYVMNSDGSGIERISFGSGSYTAPVWSPRGDLIAFTKQEGDFSIGVMRTDGSSERLITNGYLIESPSWAPNGRVIIYTREQRGFKKQPRRSRLYSIDITGYNDREVKTPKDASDPEWSNVLD